jgi:ABC-type Fe3+-hydroxamate transport system substrate-binding protein
MRVVSLVPSATETLLAWGVEPVAVTRFCELGDRFPTVGGTKDPDIEAIAAARPDVVVMCDQENRLPDAEELRALNICVHVVSITELDHVGPQMRDLALAVGVAPSLGDACGVRREEDPPITAVAFVPIWKRPWMAIGADTYGGSLLRALGIGLVGNGGIDRYPTIDPEQARAAGATCVLAPTEPYPFAERHRSTLEVVGPVTFVDGQDLFWWGARTPRALTRLQRALTS